MGVLIDIHARVPTLRIAATRITRIVMNVEMIDVVGLAVKGLARQPVVLAPLIPLNLDAIMDVTDRPVVMMILK
jgi:hypothetical protein